MTSSRQFRSQVRITAIGHYVPERVLTNADLERMVETSDEWIVQRTGIRERRIAADGELASDLCVQAARNLASRFDRRLDDVDLVLVATISGDHITPSTATQVQAKLGLSACGAFDLNAACVGFVYALHVASGLITSGLHRKALVFGAETLSRLTDYTDRTTCILFGDGAGAALVERCGPEDASFLGPTYLDTQGDKAGSLYCTRQPGKWWGADVNANGRIVQNGREVYKWAVSHVPAGAEAALRGAGLYWSGIDWFVPHSANARMIESISERAGFPPEKTLLSLETFGNTSAATIPLAISSAVEAGRVRSGDRLLLYGFGGGLVQAGMVVRWNPPSRA